MSKLKIRIHNSYRPHPRPLSKGRGGVKCLVGAWWLCLFVLVITLHLLLFPLVEALHITPLSPRRGVGGEASRGWGRPVGLGG